MPVSAKHKSLAAYNYGAMLLHWLIALFIIAQLCGGYVMMHYAALADRTRFTFFQLHKTIGILILLLTLMRLIWRIFYRPPADLPLGKAEKALKNLVTFLFYALMLSVPLLGWAVVSLSPTRIPTLLFGNPQLVWPSLPLARDAALYAQASWAHIILAYGFALLLFLHICGALKHQFYDHMPEMARMLPTGRLPSRRAGLSVFILLFLLISGLGAGIIYLGSYSAGQSGTTPAQIAAGNPAQPNTVKNSAADSDSANWAVDYKQSSVTYAMEFSGTMKNGAIASWEADIRFDPDRLNTAKAVILLDSGSVSYEDDYIKGDISAEDGLAAAQYPHIRVEFDQFSKKDGQKGAYQAKGIVTIRGIARPLTLDFRFSEENGQAIVDGQADLNRLSFNLGEKNDPDAEWLGNIIHVKIHLIARRKASGAD